MRNLLSLERKKRELQPVQKFDPSLVSAKFRKSGSAYPIHLIPKKKKETFDFKSLTTRPPLTDAYPVAEKFPTKGKKRQKQSESVCSELKSLNLHNLLTIRVRIIYEGIEWLSTRVIKFYQRRSVTFKSSTTHPSLTRLIESSVLQVFAKVSIHETVYPVTEKYTYQRRKRKETYIKEIHGLSYRKSI